MKTLILVFYRLFKSPPFKPMKGNWLYDKDKIIKLYKDFKTDKKGNNTDSNDSDDHHRHHYCYYLSLQVLLCCNNNNDKSNIDKK